MISSSSSSSSSSFTFIAGLLVLLFLWALLASDATATTTAASSNDLTRIEENSSNDGSIMIIEDFAHPQHPWGVMNDPVMGGQSTSSITIANGTAQFRGNCAIVPFLKAPGFITMVTGGYRQPTQQFPNIETCQAFRLVLQSHTDYAGYYMSFGTVQLPEKRHARGYKTHLEIPQSAPANNDDDDDDGYYKMTIPFANFSSNWNEGTGQIEVSCQDDARYCPTPEALQDLQTISFWGEGIQGDVALDIRSIAAVQCASSNDDDDDASSSKNNNSTDDDPSLPNKTNNTDAANNDNDDNSNNPSSAKDKTGHNADSRNHHHTLFWLVAMGGVLYWTRDSWKGYLPHTTASSTGGSRYDAVPEIQLA